VEEGDEFTDFAPIFTVGAQRGWGIPLFSRSGSPPSPPTPRRIGQSSSSLPGESDNVRQGWTVKFRHTTRRRLRGVPPVLPSRLRLIRFPPSIAADRIPRLHRRRRSSSEAPAMFFPRASMGLSACYSFGHDDSSSRRICSRDRSCCLHIDVDVSADRGQSRVDTECRPWP
jgi:hypothetical protein